MTSPEWPTATELSEQLARLRTLVESEPVRIFPQLQQVLKEARSLGQSLLEAQALMALAGCCLFQSRYPEMLRYAEDALGLARDLHLPKLEAQALNSVGLAFQRLGSLQQAMTAVLESLRLSSERGDQEGCCRALSNIALIYVSLGEYEMAAALHKQALELARLCGHAPYIADTLSSLMDDYFRLGRYREALDLSDEAISFARGRGLTRYECYARTTLSLTLLGLRRVPAALVNAEAGQAVARQAGDQESLVALLLAAGQAHLALRNHDLAEKDLTEALHLSLALQHREHEWEAHRLLAVLYDTGQDGARAQHHRKQAQACAAAFSLEGDGHAGAPQMQHQLRTSWPPQKPLAPYAWAAELEELRQSVQQIRSELSLLSRIDLMTGLMNRTHFRQRAQRRLDLMAEGEHLAMVFIGLDGMKSLNERFGRTLGDSVLVETARRIEAALRPGDLVARLGSDEFVVMFSYLAAPGDLDLLLPRLQAVFQQPFGLRGQPIQVTASFGGVVYPGDCNTLAQLMKCADLALHHARAQGRGMATRYDAQLLSSERRRRSLLHDLQGAIAERQLSLHYQGIFSVPERRLIGVEALSRWQHPVLGLIMPDTFIPLAEQLNLIAEQGEWVIEEACRQISAWQAVSAGLTVSVNVSALQFAQPDFVKKVRRALETHGTQPEHLVLELTESMVHEDEARAAAMLHELHDLGVRSALDDFGSGFSSLGSLQNLPLDCLKIDRTFMVDLSQPSEQLQRGKMILDMMTNLAHNMNMRVVAEGVEQAEQFELLTALKCDLAQGYWLARPLSAADFERKWLAGPG